MNSLYHDYPITNSEDDLLERVTLVMPIRRVLHESIASGKSTVMGITGPWGSGKSSFKNLLLAEYRECAELHLLEFDPWQFDNAESMQQCLFREIESFSVENNLEAVARYVKNYGKLLATVAKIISEKGGQVAETVLEMIPTSEKKLTIERSKRELAAELEKLTKPILVVIDEIDRMDADEIRSLFKCVKANFNLPNIHFVLLYDQEKVQASLAKSYVEGERFLEKIVTFSYALPIVNRHRVGQLLFKELKRVIEGKYSPEYLDLLQKVITTAISPALDSIRTMSRFLNSFRVVWNSQSDDLDLIDALLLHTIKFFYPDIFILLPGLAGWFSTNFSFAAIGSTQNWTDHPKARENKEFIEAIDKCPQKSLVLECLFWMFPRVVWFEAIPNGGRDENKKFGLRICDPESFSLFF